MEHVPETFVVAQRVFDGFEVREGIAVGVRAGEISRLIPVADVPETAVRRNLDGATLTPGLIDAHVHVAPWMIFGFLAAGVTTVRDLGNDLDKVGALLTSLPDTPSPNIIWSGPLLETGRTNWPPLARGHDTADAIRASVDELAERGLRAIKLYYNTTPEHFVAATERAHAHGMRVLAHLGATSLRVAVDAGVDEIQHLSGTSSSEQRLPDWAEAARVAASYQVDHCPTVNGWDSFAHWAEPRSFRDSAFDWVHPGALAGWTRANQATQSTEQRLGRLSRVLEHMGTVRALHAVGRGILVGSDSPFPGLVPGFSLHDEAGLLVQAGISPLEVMIAMTSGNAARMGSPAGRLVAGAPADLAAFSGDPTARVSDLSRIEGVWHDGVEVDLLSLRLAADTVFDHEASSPVDRVADGHYTPAALSQ